MAADRRRSTSAYRTYGSAAYAPAYDGNTVRAPRREEELRWVPPSRPKKQIRRHERAKVEVRQAGAIAPFAVIGFLAVAVFAALLMISYTDLMVANNEMVALRKELSALKEENITLSAQYEKVFDLDTVQKAVGDTMVRPTGDQVIYIDLSEPDTVTVYQEPALGASLLDGAKDILGSIIEYFR